MGGSRLCINIYKNKTARMCISNPEQKYREADSRLILYFFHVCGNYLILGAISCQIQFRTRFANQFRNQCVTYWLSTTAAADRQHAFLSCPTGLVLCFVELQLTVLPVKMCFKTWYMLLLLQVKSSNTGFEQRHTLQKKEVYVWWNDPAKCFKICHISYIWKPNFAFSIFHFVLLYFFP